MTEIKKSYKDKLIERQQAAQRETAKKVAKEFAKVDQLIGAPEFYNEYERKFYKKTVDYYDQTGFNSILLDTLSYLYNHPCTLSECKKLFKLVLSATGESTPSADAAAAAPQGTAAIKFEIRASKMRIDTLKEEINKWFVILLRCLRRRKVHNEFGMFDQPVFNSNHLLDAFSIFSRPEEVPEEELLAVLDPSEEGAIPYLVEPGDTYLRNSENIEYDEEFECEVDIKRENLKYVDIVNGFPQELVGLLSQMKGVVFVTDDTGEEKSLISEDISKIENVKALSATIEKPLVLDGVGSATENVPAEETYAQLKASTMTEKPVLLTPTTSVWKISLKSPRIPAEEEVTKPKKEKDDGVKRKKKLKKNLLLPETIKVPLEDGVDDIYRVPGLVQRGEKSHSQRGTVGEKEILMSVTGKDTALYATIVRDARLKAILQDIEDSSKDCLLVDCD